MLIADDMAIERRLARIRGRTKAADEYLPRMISASETVGAVELDESREVRALLDEGVSAAIDRQWLLGVVEAFEETIRERSRATAEMYGESSTSAGHLTH